MKKALLLAAALSVTWLLSASPANAAGRSEAIPADVSEELNATSVKARLIDKLGADALWITVSVSGETATLTGEMSKLPRRGLVEQLALSVKGIRKVDNQVTVGANGKSCPTRHPKEDTTAAGLATFWGPDSFPNVVLTTQDGKRVRFRDDLLKDKQVLVNFIYTECGTSCPLATAKLAQVQRILGDRMGKDILFCSISLDPTRDTPKVLNRYAAKFKAGPGWLFLTGRKSDIELVRRKMGQAAGPAQNELIDHSSTLMIGNTTTGQWQQAGVTDDARQIAVLAGNRREGYARAQRVEEGTANRGMYLFQNRCAACHTIGHGDKIGPDLIGVAEVRDKSWLTHYVSAPDEVLASGDRFVMALFEKYKRVRMPNLCLAVADVDALINFLEVQSVSSHDVETTEQRAKGVVDSVELADDDGTGGLPN